MAERAIPSDESVFLNAFKNLCEEHQISEDASIRYLGVLLARFGSMRNARNRVYERERKGVAHD
jgi:hypothetical protein